jgi:hypothetical protein
MKLARVSTAIVLAFVAAHARADDFDAATVHVVGVNDVMIQHANVIDGRWVDVCRSPCTTTSAIGGFYRAGDAGKPIVSPHRSTFSLNIVAEPRHWLMAIVGGTMFGVSTPAVAFLAAGTNLSTQEWTVPLAAVSGIISFVGLIIMLGGVVASDNTLTVVARAASMRIAF